VKSTLNGLLTRIKSNKDETYRQQLTYVDWETLFGHNDVDTIVDIITNTILNIADNTIPNRFITVQKDSRPWITTSIKKKIHT
jgi:hypothetical protein